MRDGVYFRRSAVSLPDSRRGSSTRYAFNDAARSTIGRSAAWVIAGLVPRHARVATRSFSLNRGARLQSAGVIAASQELIRLNACFTGHHERCYKAAVQIANVRGLTIMAQGSVSRRLSRCHTIEDLRTACRGQLPLAPFDYIDGGAEEEVTLARNRASYAEYAFRPRALADVSRIALSTEILGQPIKLPVILSPCGWGRLVDRQGEISAARAAHLSGTLSVLSSMSNFSIEEVADATDGPIWYQIYLWRDRGVVRDLIARARASGYQALCLTVDMAIVGQRERDLRSGIATIPPSPTLRTKLDVACHPRWAWNAFGPPKMRFAATMAKYVSGGRADNNSVAEYVNSQLELSLDWSYLDWILAEWNGPFAIKGVLRSEDALRAVDAGVSAVFVSNHGGRQLDHAPATIQVLPEIAKAVQGRAEIILDGGVRRGTDVVKALALGARACAIGRPYLYGLGAGGVQGAIRTLEILRDEIARALTLLGCSSVRDLGEDYVFRVGHA